MVTYGPSRVMLALAFVLGLPLLAWAVIGQWGAENVDMAWLMAPLFLAFGLFKGAVGFDALHRIRQGGPGSEELLASHGGVGEVRRWAQYKITAMVVALLAAGLCLVLAGS